jgi:hypothetical protein
LKQVSYGKVFYYQREPNATFDEMKRYPNESPVPQNVCFPLYATSGTKNFSSNLHYLAMVFWVANVVLFVIAIYNTWRGGKMGLDAAGWTSDRPKGLVIYHGGLLLLIRLIYRDPNWMGLTDGEKESIKVYETKSKTKSVYVGSYAPLFVMSMYLLACGPRNLLLNGTALIAYVVNVITIIPKLPYVLLALKQFQCSCYAYIGLAIGMILIFLPIVGLFVDVRL